MRTQQVVEPAIGAAGLDDRAKRHERANASRIAAVSRQAIFTGSMTSPLSSNGRHDDELTMQVDTNVPHNRSPCLVECG